MLSVGAEREYVQALVEPFHPHTNGARVPETVPRETAIYNSF